jgi:hypothetical protein
MDSLRHRQSTVVVLSVRGRGLNVGRQVLRLLLGRGEGEEGLFLRRVIVVGLDRSVAVSSLDKDEDEGGKNDNDGDDDSWRSG